MSNHSEHDLFYTIVDGLPASFERPFPVSGTCKMHAATTITYETSASKRGKYVIKKLYVRYTSTLGLWQKQMTIDDMHTVRVIPDLSETKHYLQDMQRYLLHEGTVIRKFQSGAGEFAQIRNYVVGDDPRMINWRQTAKLREVMTNEYEPRAWEVYDTFTRLWANDGCRVGGSKSLRKNIRSCNYRCCCRT
ncbi:DUF58 domain-containing protein [Paracerasibacillus soli]|uniref:DUF58 domain-containing protein n=1 Tax=Paracerasibacillus soli TaxID=480284 RepID=A0ABU5CRM0_9BACI|nr:DUF58 domain-containing protein [Virgibacillus soli]MDY0408890.1 DUF58 domain-containing protein [Virgibacillus soli]